MPMTLLLGLAFIVLAVLCIMFLQDRAISQLQDEVEKLQGKRRDPLAKPTGHVTISGPARSMSEPVVYGMYQPIAERINTHG